MLGNWLCSLIISSFARIQQKNIKFDHTYHMEENYQDFRSRLCTELKSDGI